MARHIRAAGLIAGDLFKINDTTATVLEVRTEDFFTVVQAVSPHGARGSWSFTPAATVELLHRQGPHPRHHVSVAAETIDANHDAVRILDRLLTDAADAHQHHLDHQAHDPNGTNAARHLGGLQYVAAALAEITGRSAPCLEDLARRNAHHRARPVTR